MAQRACVGLRCTRGVKHDDLWSMKRIEAPAFHAGAGSLAFVVRDPEAAGGSHAIWVMNVATGRSARCLVSGPEPKSSLAWAPDGSRLALSMRGTGEEHAQIYIANVHDGSLTRVTAMPHGAYSPRWRPDGGALLFESARESHATARSAIAPSVRSYGTMPVRWWNKWLGSARPHPFVLVLNSTDGPLDLLAGSRFASSAGFRGILVISPSTTTETLQAQWAANGRSIVFAAYHNADVLVRARLSSAIFKLPATGGDPEMLTPRDRSFAEPHFSASGCSLYALERHWPDGHTRTDLVRWDYRTASEPVCLTADWDRSVSSFVLSPDDSIVYLNVEDRGINRIFTARGQGSPISANTDDGTGNVRAFAADTQRVFAFHETHARAPEIVEISTGTRAQARITSLNDEISARIDARAPLEFSFQSRGGAHIHNLLFLPPRFDPRRRYPLITCIHGGPHVMAADIFLDNWLSPPFLTRPGYVVLCTNYSGSTGFGREFAESVEQDVLRLPANEILEAALAAVERFEFIDGSRQAMVGGSYGGYLVNWLNGQTQHFRCAVAHAGAINNLSQYGSSDCGLDREVRMNGPVWEGSGQWMEQNPFRFAGSFATPTLVTHGEQDFRVPVTESLTTFKLLQRMGVESRLVVFPDEGHFISSRANSRVLWRETWTWLRRYL
jgi:dipeptidyl aminopeptidase/acylaminoacyl peptidase